MTITCEKTSEMEPIEIPCEMTITDLKKKILPCILDIGECLMNSGADVNHVERLVNELGYSYGARKMNVLVITHSIIVTMTMPNGEESTQTRRVYGGKDTDFEKLENLNKLCRECELRAMAPDELKNRFEEINSQQIPRSWFYGGGILGVASYTGFFGGSWMEILISAIVAAFLCFLIEKLSPITPNKIGFNLISTFLAGTLIGVFHMFIPDFSSDAVVIGTIMLMVPGLAMTNAIRDMMSGDTLSGILRFLESLLWTGAMTIGYLIPLMFMSSGVDPNPRVIEPIVKVGFAFFASLGFLLYYNSKRKLLVLGLVGAVITFSIFIYLDYDGRYGCMIPGFVAGVFASIFSEYFSKKLHVPSAVFFITCVLPMIPGRFLYTMMNAIVTSNTEVAYYNGICALEYSLGIAMAICLVWTLSRTWRNLHVKKNLKKIAQNTKTLAQSRKN